MAHVAKVHWIYVLVLSFNGLELYECVGLLNCRVCGGGSVTEGVQRFIWDHCLSKGVRILHSLFHVFE